jgi:hypothetical protein
MKVASELSFGGEIRYKPVDELKNQSCTSILIWKDNSLELLNIDIVVFYKISSLLIISILASLLF